MTDPLDVAGPNPWQTRSSHLIYDDGRLRIREDQVIQPDGEPGRYSYVEVPRPFVAIVPVDDAGHVHLVRQWRYPWRRNSWEVPAGVGEGDEAPLDAARRELAEEVGLHAAFWESLGSGYSSATLDARWHLYLARGLSAAGDGFKRDGAERDLIARRVPLVDAVEAALSGRIEHAMCVVALLRAARRLGMLGGVTALNVDPSAAQC